MIVGVLSVGDVIFYKFAAATWSLVGSNGFLRGFSFFFSFKGYVFYYSFVLSV